MKARQTLAAGRDVNGLAVVLATSALVGLAAVAVINRRSLAEMASDDVDGLEALAPETDLTAPVRDMYGQFTSYLTPHDDPMQAEANLAAFLRTIRIAEGTAGPNGYRTLFGGSLFTGYGDHPRIAKQFTDKAGRTLWTSAAGAFQFMAISGLPNGSSTRVNTWDRIAQKLSLPDFTPESQDLAAIELVREAGALHDVRAGRFADAIHKCRGTWASLPGAGYSQPEKSLASLEAAFINSGGTITA
jgi:muramidase (phage lysozyme)